MGKVLSVNANTEMSEQELKAFGLLMAWAFPLFIGIIAPWFLGKYIQWWSLWVSISFIIASFLAPKFIYIPYKAWMFIGGIFGFINTRIILGITFYLLIFPVGLMLRLLKKSQFKKHNNTCSNYVKRTDKLTKKQLENPF